MTKDEKNTVAKLMLVVVNAFDPTRKEAPIPYGESERHPEFSLEQLRTLANDALAEAQKIMDRKSY